MLAILVVCLLICVLTYYQIFKQGLFSSLLMAVLSICAALIALNYFELLAAKLVEWGLGSYGPQAISLLGLFIVSLLVLREISDRVIRGNMNFSLLTERIGAAVFGLVASLVIVGMIVLGFQLLPIGAKFLMYDRFETDKKHFQQASGLFPGPDAFVLSVMQQASEYCFRGKGAFGREHPDFLRELYANRLVLDPGSRQEASKGALRLTGPTALMGDQIDTFERRLRRKATRTKKAQYEITPGKRYFCADGETLIHLKVRVLAGSDNKKNRRARDKDGKVRFTMGSFRLVGYGDSAEVGVARYPLGFYKERFVDKKGRGYEKGLFPLTLDKGLTQSGDVTVDLVFSWPHKKTDSSQLGPKPLYLEFKRSVRVAL